MTARPRPHSLWVWVAEPRTVTAVGAAPYPLLLAAGLAGFLAPPAGALAALGHPTLVDLWCTLLVLGGGLGLAGSLPGWWYVERAGLLGAASGLGMYAVAVSQLPGLPGEVLAARVFLTAALIASLAARWVRISGATLDPSRAPNAPTHAA